MKEIKKIDPASLAQILGLIYLIVGFLFGLVIVLIDVALGVGQFSLLGGWVALLPIVYAFIFAILGIVSGLIGAALYNVFAKRIGGIKIDLK